MLFVIGLPMVQVVLFCMAVGRDPAGLKLAIVNHDSAPGVPCPAQTGCNLTLLACRYLSHLSNYPVVQVSECMQTSVIMRHVLQVVRYVLAGHVRGPGERATSGEHGRRLGCPLFYGQLHGRLSSSNVTLERC